MRRIALLPLVLLLLAPWTASAQGRPTAELSPPAGVLLGAYVRPTAAPWSSGGVASLETTLGRRLAIDAHYATIGLSLSLSGERADIQRGVIPLLSLKPPQAADPLDAITSGADDAAITASARQIAALHGEIMVRPLWEMNGDWMSWNGQWASDPQTTDGPAKYVTAWRRIYALFQAAGATNVVWVWAPSVHDVPSASWNHWTNYYPGDAYVDWIGIDGYNRGTSEPASRWRSFESLFQPLYADYAAEKPIIVTEAASCEQGGSKAQWFTDLGRVLPTDFPDIQAFVYFDVAKGCGFQIDSSQTSLTAFQQLAVSPYLSATP